jgi:hypothetical protein
MVAAGCGDDLSGPAPAEYEQLCGQDGPVKLLDIDPARVPKYVAQREVGERYVIRLGFDSEEPGGELWSVGRCGEDPLQLTEGVGYPRTYENWPGLVFACDESSGMVLAIDPTGERPPNPVFETRECFMSLSSTDMISVLGEGETGPLVRQLWPEDPLTQPAEQIVLLDEAKAFPTPSSDTYPGEFDVLARHANEVLAITAADELVVLDIDAPAPTVLAQGVREFRVGGSDGRWIIWQDVEITNDNPDWPEGPIFVLDRETGESAQLEDSALAYNLHDSMVAADLGLLYYRTGGWGDASAGRWVRLDTFESFEVPAPITPTRVIDENRLLVAEGLRPPFMVFDLSTGELDTLYSGSWMRVSVQDEGLDVLRGNDDELLHIDYDGNSRLLAHSAYIWYRRTSDDHVITPHGVGDDDIGSLVIVDPVTLDAHYIEHDVLSTSPAVFEHDDGLLVSYAIVDPDPDRHGVWLAKPGQ